MTSDIATLIADMVNAGVDADIIGRTAELLASNEAKALSRPKSNAERQAKYRENKRKSEKVTKSNENVTPVTESKEKEKSNKKEKETPLSLKKNPPKGGQKERVFPPWLDLSVWEDYQRHRKQLGKPLTATAADRALKKLDRLRTSGQDPTAIIEQSLENGWTGLFELKERKHGNTNGNNEKPTRSEKIADAKRQALADLGVV